MAGVRLDSNPRGDQRREEEKQRRLDEKRQARFEVPLSIIIGEAPHLQPEGTPGKKLYEYFNRVFAADASTSSIRGIVERDRTKLEQAGIYDLANQTLDSIEQKEKQSEGR